MASKTAPKEFLRFTGHAHLASRLVLSTLTGRPIHVSQIRSDSPTSPGLAPHEISLLRLLEAVTNGADIQISYTGTTLTYSPGLITGTGVAPGSGAAAAVADDDGAAAITHSLPATNTRGATYFLAPLCLLAPFAKTHVNVRLAGPGVITAATTPRPGGGHHHADEADSSVDSLRTALLPLYAHFGIPPARVELRVLTRSCAGLRGRGGGGVVELRFAGQVRLPRTLHLHRGAGRVRRIRGVAYATGVAASNNGRMIAAARELLNRLCPDVHVAAQYDPAPTVAVAVVQGKGGAAGTGSSSGKGQEKRRTGLGFGLSLVAESSVDGVLYASDAVSSPDGGSVPEDVGRRAALLLVEAVAAGGCVDGGAATTVLTLMAMGSEDVGRVRLARKVLAREDVVALAMDLKKFGGANWGFREAAGGGEGEAAGGGEGEGEEEEEQEGRGEDAARKARERAAMGDLVVSVKGSGVGNVGRKIA